MEDTASINQLYIMVIETSDYLHRLEANQFNLFTQKLHRGISNLLNKFETNLIKQNDNTYIVSFDLVTNAILCALKIQSNFKYITPKFDKSIRRLKIGISDNQTLSIRMCEIVKDEIVISSLIKKDYKKENRNAFINKEHIRTLNHKDETFLTNLMNYLETIWNKPNFSIAEFSQALGFSGSHIYRKIKSLSGKPPNSFVRDFRLNRALNLLHKRKGNITAIAAQTGFKSATYFTKCFKDNFGVTPTTYSKQHTFSN